MNLNTKYNLKMTFPISIDKWGRQNTYNVLDHFVTMGIGKEYPINTLHPLYITERSNIGRGIRWKDNELLSRRIYLREIKTINKMFYEGFSNLYGFGKYTNAQGSYFVGKGIITDKNFDPFIMVTYRLEDEDLENIEASSGDLYTPVKINPNRLKIYVSRKIFYPNFTKENTRISRELFTEIIPSLEALKLPMVLKQELDMYNTVYIDNGLDKEALQLKFKKEIENIDEQILRDILFDHTE